MTPNTKNISLTQELNNIECYRKGELKLSTDRTYPEPHINKLNTDCGNIYMFIIENKKFPKEIIYIGCTSKTIEARFKEHVSGYKGGHVTGAKNNKLIVEILKKGAKIGIYSRHSQEKKILGKNISLYLTEEKVLIEKYSSHQLLNKRKKGKSING